MEIPKLDDQDDFLVNLQNNNYSTQTILNYARDLCIFAVFLHFRNTPFMKVTKKDISAYKGYLIAGQHLKDLDKIREEYTKNIDISGLNEHKALGGSQRPVNDLTGVSTPKFEDGFLSDIYRKVYGSLGITSRPRNTAKKNSGLDPNSINRMLSALRSFLKFRIEWDLDIPMPPDAIGMMKAEKRIKKVASKEELIKLIECPMEFEKDEKVALRNRCMLEMLFATGMRISELMSLDLKDINAEGKLYILGKGKKERTVFMTPRSLLWLNNYLKIRLRFANTGEEKKKESESFTTERETLEGEDENDKPSDLTLEMFDDSLKYIRIVEKYRESGYLEKFESPALFIPFSGGRDGKHSERLSINYFQEKIAQYRRKLGIQIPTSAHSLRHGFATYLAEEGASPVALQVLLGHSSLNTTTKYVHASEKFAEETVKEHHPLK
ncbi:MAG: tyrosine-type recombinase/integrase [Candidatus Dojkabacteria bacterium]|jgi:integrase/recombinase XerD